MIIYDALDRGQKKVSMKYYKKIEFANRIGVSEKNQNIIINYNILGKTYEY